MTHVVPGDAYRRALLLGVAAAAIAALPPWRAASASFVDKTRSNWAFCNKCNVLFYDAERSNVCPAGGQHTGQGHRFDLPYDGRETENVQTRWVSCKYCSAMFFNGYRQKGHCPVRRGYKENGHVADPTFRYALPHGIEETSRAQASWRFCSKCFSLFFDGNAAKGLCQAGGGHVAQGHNFVLPHGKRSATAVAD